MKVVSVLIAVMVVGVLSALAGLTAGINFNPQSTVKFVPDWGSLGDWVSGVGAFGAIWVALALANKQRSQELPDLRFSMSGKYTFTLVNHGKLPVMVNAHNVILSNPKGGGSFWFGPDCLSNDPQVVELAFGQQVSFKYSEDVLGHIVDWINSSCGGNFQDMRFIVGTPTKAFDFPADDYLINHIRFEMKKSPLTK